MCGSRSRRVLPVRHLPQDRRRLDRRRRPPDRRRFHQLLVRPVPRAAQPRRRHLSLAGLPRVSGAAGGRGDQPELQLQLSAGAAGADAAVRRAAVSAGAWPLARRRLVRVLPRAAACDARQGADLRARDAGRVHQHLLRTERRVDRRVPRRRADAARPAAGDRGRAVRAAGLQAAPRADDSNRAAGRAAVARVRGGGRDGGAAAARELRTGRRGGLARLPRCRADPAQGDARRGRRGLASQRVGVHGGLAARCWTCPPPTPPRCWPPCWPQR